MKLVTGVKATLILTLLSSMAMANPPALNERRENRVDAHRDRVENKQDARSDRHDAREDRYDAIDDCSDKLLQARRENCVEEEREDWADDRYDERKDNREDAYEDRRENRQDRYEDRKDR